VLANLFKDFRNNRWGRWRASSAAVRLGPLAVQLETLVYRDGHRVSEGIEILKSREGASERELRRLLSHIPSRVVPREVSLTAIQEPVSEVSADERLWTEATLTSMERAELALRKALGMLPPEDRLILRMRFWDDCSVADIARALGVEQKPLYRRLEAIQARLRSALEESGFGAEEASALLSRSGDA
jgi:RNA polymerase sigma factor for flagellar operon FliA